MVDKEGVKVPRVSVLEGFIEASARSEGFFIDTLPLGTILMIETQDSHYRLAVLDPKKRLINISSFDSSVIREPTRGRINGSTFGGSMLKVGKIGVGMRLELILDNGNILTTSMVISISLMSFSQPSVSIN